MDRKKECDLSSCARKFAPTVSRQRFCCVTHRNKWHQLERTRLLKMLRDMGVKR